MNARAVQHAEGRLRDLNRRAAEGAALAAVAFASALAATELSPDLAVPALLGAIAMAFTSARAFVGARLLVEDLSLDADAYCIAEVRRAARRATALERRRQVAAWIRDALDASSGRVERVEVNRARLEQLDAALLDERLEISPASAVALERMTRDGWAFYGSSPPTDELRSRLQRILAAFSPASSA